MLGMKRSRILAQRMISLLRDGEFVARLGGDEFAAVHRTRSHADLMDFLTRLETATLQAHSSGRL